jgi:hypothetical protein
MKHKIFWENNSRIKGIVPAEQIIKKTQTHNFPCEAVTIRMHDLNSKNPIAVAYFHGKESQHIGWGGQNHSFAETKLIVTFNKEKEEYGFNGAINSFSLQDLKEVLDSVREVLNKV